MFSRSKNRKVELKLEDSNYSPAPSPQSLQPQPAIGKDHSINLPNNQNSSSNRHIQEIARTYNEVNRPLPNTVNTLKKQPSVPTVINNYYYVQPNQPTTPPTGMSSHSLYSQPLISRSSPRMHKREPPAMMTYDKPRRADPQQGYQICQIPRDYRGLPDARGQQGQIKIKIRKSPSSSPPKSGYPRFPSFTEGYNSSDDSTYYDHDSPRISRNSPKDLEFDRNCDRGYDSFRDSCRYATDNIRSASMLKPKNLPYQAADSVYDSFVMSTSSSSHSKRSSDRSTFDKKCSGIYSTKTFDSHSRFLKCSDGYKGEYGDEARIPNIRVDSDNDFVDKFNDLELSHGFNILDKLISMNDANINVHDDNFFQLFKKISHGSDFINIEQLGAVLYDPLRKKRRFTFKSLALILATFISNGLDKGELDFRNFVKMCKFVKGCFISFKYHDKVGNDHLLDFNEFYNALKSNNINCSDELLARIFATDESIDLEHYLVAIIMIRKEEKKK